MIQGRAESMDLFAGVFEWSVGWVVQIHGQWTMVLHVVIVGAQTVLHGLHEALGQCAVRIELG